MNLISGICFIAGGALGLIGMIILMSAKSQGAVDAGNVMMMLTMVGITTGGVFHMLKK